MAKFGRKTGIQNLSFFYIKKCLFCGYIQIPPSLQDYIKNEVGKVEDHYAKSQQLKQDELYNFPFSYEDIFPSESQKLFEIFELK